LEKEVKGLKHKLKKDLRTASDKNKGDLQKMKASFPTYAIKCVPLYIHSTQCCSHVPSSNHYNYFLHFRSNNFNYFASKLTKASSGQEIRARLDFRTFPQTLSSPISKNSTLNSQFLLQYVTFVTENILAA
jgi:hypothetical protein